MTKENNNQEIKKYQPESQIDEKKEQARQELIRWKKINQNEGESSTTAIQRKEREEQIIKKFNELIELVPTDEQLTGDEKVRNYFLEREEQLKRRKEENKKEQEIWEICRKNYFEKNSNLDRLKNLFMRSVISEETEWWSETRREFEKWMGPERTREREKWERQDREEKSKALGEDYWTKPKYKTIGYSWDGRYGGYPVIVEESGWEHTVIAPVSIESQQLEKVKSLISDKNNQSEVRKFTSTAKNELEAIKRDFNELIGAQNIVIEAREKELERKEKNLQGKIGELAQANKREEKTKETIKNFEVAGEQLKNKLISNEKANKEQNKKLIEISEKLEQAENNFLKLETEKNRLTSEDEDLNEQLTIFKDKEKEWEAQKQEIISEKENHKKEIKRQTEEIEKLKNELQEKEVDKAKIEQLQRENNDLSEQNELIKWGNIKTGIEKETDLTLLAEGTYWDKEIQSLQDNLLPDNKQPIVLKNRLWQRERQQIEVKIEYPPKRS